MSGIRLAKHEDLEELEEKVVTLENFTVLDNKVNLKADQSAVNTLTGTVNTLEDQIEDVAGNVGGNTLGIESNSIAIDDIQGNIGTHADAIAKLQTDLEELREIVLQYHPIEEDDPEDN